MGFSQRAKLRQAGFLLFFSLAYAFFSAFSSAYAAWPERPVKLIVTFPPGSASDAAARLFADALARKWGQPVVVEDKPGAEGTLGVAAFLAAKDNHTLLYTVAGSVSTAPLLIERLPYDPARDLKPISATTMPVLTLAVSNSLHAASIPELIDVLRGRPGVYAWAAGPTFPRYAFAAFLKRRDLRMNFVAYRDAAQPQADLGEGRIQALVTSLTASSSPVQTGKARFLAVLNPVRSAAVPDLATVRELGYPELEVDGTSGIFGSSMHSEAIAARIASDVSEICRDDIVRQKLEAAGHNVLHGSTDELKDTIERQRSLLAEISRLIDIRNAQ